jgi:hypothetical protein
MLSEMVLTIESAGVQAFACTLLVVVTFEVLGGGVRKLTVEALGPPKSIIEEGRNHRRAYPFLK